MATGDDWTDEELRASVECYRAMLHAVSSGRESSKAEEYRKLAARFNRTPKAFEFRMQNISAVLDLAGEEWLTGLKPAKNVGANIAKRLVSILQVTVKPSSVVKDASEIDQRPDIDVTTKKTLIEARLGQGRFRNDVLEIEPRCRVTGVDTPEHLRASHIKPWRASTDKERLSGANGLMLSPHIDHLFDRGLVSFRDSGTLIVSSAMDRRVLTAWHVDVLQHGVPLASAQRAFMEFHRDVVLK